MAVYGEGRSVCYEKRKTMRFSEINRSELDGASDLWHVPEAVERRRRRRVPELEMGRLLWYIQTGQARLLRLVNRAVDVMVYIVASRT